MAVSAHASSSRHWVGKAWLSPGMGLFLGEIGQHDDHHHDAHQISIGLTGPLCVSNDQQQCHGHAMVIPAGIRHQVSGGAVLSLYLDALSEEARVLRLSQHDHFSEIPVAVIALTGVLVVAGFKRVQPFRRAWLHDHGDTGTALLHNIVNLAAIQFAATVLVTLGEYLPNDMRLFPSKAALWWQVLLVAIVLDLSFYGMHRLSHRVSWLWRLHAPHHSAERLYWLNGERRPPLHAMLMAGPGLMTLILLGTPAAPIATWFGMLTVHLAFQHANLDYRVGVLRHLLGVAESHRWHHKRDFEDAQVNYGEFFLLWDRLFGSYFDRATALGDAEVGLCERHYPRRYVAQLLQPFRRTDS